MDYKNDYFYTKRHWGSGLFDRDYQGNIVETYWFHFARKNFNGIVSLFMSEQNRQYLMSQKK